MNLPVLYRNIMDGLPSDLSRDAFLWATERTSDDPMLYKAERFAREADQIVSAISLLLDKGFKQHSAEAPPSAHDDLVHFFIKRLCNWRFGGNQQTWMKGKP